MSCGLDGSQTICTARAPLSGANNVNCRYQSAVRWVFHMPKLSWENLSKEGERFTDPAVCVPIKAGVCERLPRVNNLCPI